MNMNMPGLDNHMMPSIREEMDMEAYDRAVEELYNAKHDEVWLLPILKEHISPSQWESFIESMIEAAGESYFRSKCNG